MIKRLSRQFKDDDWNWLATVDEFEKAARQSEYSDELYKLGVKLLAGRNHPIKRQAVLAG